MVRIVKKAEVRRMEIIKAAKRLFDESGYDNTPVEAIIKEAGIAKGTFYYYFKTKQEILKAIVEQVGLDMEMHFQSIVGNAQLKALEKLKLMLTGEHKRNLTQSRAMDMIHKPENRELQEELNIQAIHRIVPLITQVLKQGHDEGIFKRKIEAENIEILFAGSQFLLDSGLFEWSEQKRTSLLLAAQTTLELVVGANAGALSFISEDNAGYGNVAQA